MFSLAGWAPQIPAEFLVLRGTQVPAGLEAGISRKGLSPAMAALSSAFRYPGPLGAAAGPTTPRAALTAAVWAPARSLAATCAIILIFSSCGY